MRCHEAVRSCASEVMSHCWTVSDCHNCDGLSRNYNKMCYEGKTVLRWNVLNGELFVMLWGTVLQKRLWELWRIVWSCVRVEKFNILKLCSYNTFENSEALCLKWEEGPVDKERKCVKSFLKKEREILGSETMKKHEIKKRYERKQSAEQEEQQCGAEAKEFNKKKRSTWQEKNWDNNDKKRRRPNQAKE